MSLKVAEDGNAKLSRHYKRRETSAINNNKKDIVNYKLSSETICCSPWDKLTNMTSGPIEFFPT